MTRLTRVGVVLSVLWALSAGWYQRSADMERAAGPGSLLQISYDWCLRGNDAISQRDLELGLNQYVGQQDCANYITPERVANAYEVWAPWPNTLFTSLAPIPFFWLAGWILIRTARWVWRGSTKKH
jgi:hypothetical protein